jgi:hypothetical protein
LFQFAPKYKFGYQIPHNYEEALRFDQINHSTKWADATKLKMSHLNDYKCFINVGIYNCDPIPEGYKKIWVHVVYDVKHDGCHKACLISDGHLTNIPIKSVYSGVISLHGL